MRYLVILFMLPWLLSGCLHNPSFAELNLKQGIEYFRTEHYREAFIRLKPLAMSGQCDAQYAIGYMYYYGKGVVEDRKKAWYWIHRAVEAKQPAAIAALEILKKQRENIMP